MAEPNLHTKLAEYIDAESIEDSLAILAKNEWILLSDSAITIISDWIEEEAENPKRKNRIEERRNILHQVRELKYKPPEEQLFLTFINVTNSNQMQQLVRQLNEDSLNLLIATAKQKLVEAQTAGETDHAESIQQRLDGLRQIWEAIQQTQNPLHQGLLQFLQTASDEDARAVLFAQPDLLLTLDAQRVLNMFRGDDEVTQQHLEARKDLWRRVRQDQFAQVPTRTVSPNVMVEWQTQPEMFVEKQALTPREETYTVINSTNCAIGDGVMVINDVCF